MQNEISTREKLRAFLLVTFLGLVGWAFLAVLLWQIPAVQQRFDWRVDFAMAYLRGLIDPVKPLRFAQDPQAQ
jgi:hypothetical protein